MTKHSWFARVFFARPDNRFTSEKFVAGLDEVGIDVGDSLDDRNGHLFGAGRRRTSGS